MTAGQEIEGMGVDKEGVVMQLAGAAMVCWVMPMGLLVIGLITAPARVGLAWVVVRTGPGLLVEVDMGLVTARLGVKLEEVVTGLVTAVDVLLVMVLELEVGELASALRRAWKAAAHFLSFKIRLWLFCCLGGGCLGGKL